MIYFFWTLPAIAVVTVLASGRAGTFAASIIGVIVALFVALTTAPHGFQISEALVFLARGAWIGWIIVPYILGGLLFWQMAIRPGNAAMPGETMRNVTMVVPVLITSCHVSEQPNIGPLMAQITTMPTAVMNAQ